MIVLVYDVTSEESALRLKTHWMPRISKVNDKVPVIFVGNKIDLRSSKPANDLTNLLNNHFLQSNQVQAGIECSAKVFLNLIDVIVTAQLTVLYPIAPLYDSVEKKIKPEFERALLRIFRICDKDGDGYMDD